MVSLPRRTGDPSATSDAVSQSTTSTTAPALVSSVKLSPLADFVPQLGLSTTTHFIYLRQNVFNWITLIPTVDVFDLYGLGLRFVGPGAKFIISCLLQSLAQLWI